MAQVSGSLLLLECVLDIASQPARLPIALLSIHVEAEKYYDGIAILSFRPT
jgi:hypothetical protein